ncbi:hypothetical protein [Paucisalibacillus globulus]|uniref:hypothetical protein n=1 Tax=Paucisalibacillus globulus TaxID=351095 RepID=UPI00047CD809|nr:hypothetical protein [Paucisalibacillus globulus]
MKKILVGLIVVSLFFVFHMVTVQGSSLPYKEKLAGMINSVENFFVVQKNDFLNSFDNQQDARNKKIAEELARINEIVSSATTNDVNQYNRNYLLNLAERREDSLLHMPFTEYTNKKSNEIDSEISEDITEFISELIEQDKNQINNGKGDLR